jgi:hypothetical protein
MHKTLDLEKQYFQVKIRGGISVGRSKKRRDDCPDYYCWFSNSWWCLLPIPSSYDRPVVDVTIG